VLNFSIFNLY